MTPSDKEGGFMLVEVLVAFALLTAVASALLAAFAAAVHGDNQAAFTTRATMLATSKLAAIGVDLPLEPGVTSGSFQNGYGWRASVRLDRPVGPEGRSGMAVFAVAITVFDPEADDQQISLATLELGPGHAR